MDTIVIYEKENGGVAILYPSKNCGLSIDEIIKKDIPSGARYKKISIEEMPSDREYREAWSYDFTGAEINS